MLEIFKKYEIMKSQVKMSDNIYIDTLQKSKIRRDVKMAVSPKREIVVNQKNKCYLCEKNLGSTMCHFAIVFGPDPKTGIPSNDMRALCPHCFYGLGKNPVKK